MGGLGRRWGEGGGGICIGVPNEYLPKHLRHVLFESPEKGQSVTINHGCTPGP